ncbi:MAG: bifunctional diguanylate cyclase/phosphodiesterase [Pseudomonadota bacterium]
MEQPEEGHLPSGTGSMLSRGAAEDARAGWRRLALPGVLLVAGFAGLHLAQMHVIDRQAEKAAAAGIAAAATERVGGAVETLAQIAAALTGNEIDPRDIQARQGDLVRAARRLEGAVSGFAASVGAAPDGFATGSGLEAPAVLADHVATLARQAEEAGRARRFDPGAAAVLAGRADSVAAATTALGARLADLAEEARGRDRMIRAVLAGGGTIALVLFGVLVVLPALRGHLRREVDLAAATGELQHLVLHDQQTDLPHRANLALQLEALLLDPEREGQSIGVVVLEITDLDELDASAGFETGEDVLREIAAVLAADAGPDDVVAKLDGSRFAVAVADALDEDELMTLAARYAEMIACPVPSGAAATRGLVRAEESGSPALPRRLEVRAGVACAEAGSSSAERMLMDACMALGSARRGAQTIILYEPAIRRAIEGQLELATRLRHALECDQIVPFFQPQVEIDTGRLNGIEALVRWIDPERGPQSPAAFLPVAETYGLMNQIDDVMRRKSLMAMRTCRDAGLGIDHLGLNLTISQLCAPGFIDRLRFDAAAVGLGPRDVAIEILESIMVDEDSHAVIDTVRQLSEAGFYIELDDFGTGHSGLSTLRDLDVDRVKIDRSFVRDVHVKPDLARFTSALIRLAQAMDIDVLAEGIECEEERLWLDEAGCGTIQGFFIARPMPLDKLIDWARETGRAPSASGDAPMGGTTDSGAPAAMVPGTVQGVPVSGTAGPGTDIAV